MWRAQICPIIGRKIPSAPSGIYLKVVEYETLGALLLMMVAMTIAVGFRPHRRRVYDQAEQRAYAYQLN